MSHINEDEIKKRFEQISNFETNPLISEIDLEKTKQSLIKLTQNKKVSGNRIWRIIMKNRITKIAASLIFATLLVSISYGTANVVKRVISGKGQVSEVLDNLPFSVPKQIDSVQIETIQSRGKVFAAQFPMEDNGYELIITFDDGSIGASDWYDVIVNIISKGSADKQSIHIKAYIDGTSNLVFQGSSVYWDHLKWDLPGRHDGNNFPTYINSIEWIPQWPGVEEVESDIVVDDTDAENRGELLSDVLDGLPFSIPREPVDIQIDKIEARGNVSISQSPTEDNEYELIVTFDDSSFVASEWYNIIVNITSKSSSSKQSIHIKAYIDGISELVFQDNHVYWHNLEWKVPGLHGGNNFPTYLNDIEWIPKWEKVEQVMNTEISLENFEEQNSEDFLLPFALPKDTIDVKIETVQARGDVSIAQLPSEDNDYELIVTFDDSSMSGPAWYDIFVNITSGNPAKKMSVNVKAYIDGISNLVFKDNSVHWSHLQWDKPGLHGGNNFPTYISTDVIQWTPKWPDSEQ